jgi:hypothetical protein
MDKHAKVKSELASFLQTWSFDKIIEKGVEQRLTREDLVDQLVCKLGADERFRHAFLANPRFVMAIATEECLGIDKYTFVRGIGQVHILQESAEHLYLILPSCHKGCMQAGITEPPAGHGGSACHVCGLTQSKMPDTARCPGQQASCSAVAMSRTAIEDRLKERARLELRFKRALINQPMEVYATYARELCGGGLPDYLAGIKDIQVFEEGLEEIYFIMPMTARSHAAA